MSKIVTVVEMVERIKEHYNLNDTLLASDLGISRKTITGWRNGNIPKVETYKKVKELYYGIEEIEMNNTEVEEKGRYELKFPPNGTILYFNDITTGAIREIVFNQDKMQLLNMYSFGCFIIFYPPNILYIKNIQATKHTIVYAIHQLISNFLWYFDNPFFILFFKFSTASEIVCGSFSINFSPAYYQNLFLIKYLLTFQNVDFSIRAYNKFLLLHGNGSH